MPWRANVVYATPSKAVIEAFRALGLGDALYLVRDLDGIRYTWVREQFFGDTPGEIRHGLPARGVLAVMPPTGPSNYDETFSPNLASQAQFDDDYGNDPALKWQKVGIARLHDTLVEIARATGEILMHYFCETSGGAPDVETAFVAKPDASAMITEGEPLVTALAALGVTLPTGFFALHTSSFDWQRYALR